MNIFDKIIDISKYKSAGLINMTCEFFALYTNKLFQQENKSILIITPNLYEANKIYNSLINYNDCLLFQTDDVITSEAIAISPELKLERLNVLKEMSVDNKKIVITDINGYLKRIPKKEDFNKNILNLEIGQEISQEKILSTLYDLGYVKESIVTQTGEVGVRGFILDIFPVNCDNPIRVEFFGDEIESIRTFDVDTQKSIKSEEKVKIYSFSEKTDGASSNIYEYLDNPIVIFKDYNQIKISYERLLNDIFEFSKQKNKKYIYNLDEIKVKNYIHYFDFDSEINDLEITKVLDFKTKPVEKLNEDIDKINKFLLENLNNNKTIILCLSTQNVNNFLQALTVPYILTNENNIIEKKFNIIKKRMTTGFQYENYIFLTEYELFNKKNEKKVVKSNFKFATRIKDLTKLQVGDYVVHNLHGIGIYNGIKTLTKNNLTNDYLEILYDKKDKLYIPASKIELISKYSGKEGVVPKINALNSINWEKTKQRVKEKIKYEAKRLLKVQAERKLQKGFAFSKDTPMQEIFENEFEFEITKDQLNTTEQIKFDMESINPMDRILCGDVGYGKTEVAFRVIFKAINDSKQVLYLCPTTLLSNQQYEAARDRFRNFPINIALLNRFTPKTKAEKILKELNEGKIDLLIGTHRLLSKDVIPKDLGLLVVDEEQRFGVAHKEKMKEFKANIDVLTLTATPIPRTLQMAMLGLKNLSLIETPPKNRHSVQTYVIEEDRKIIRDIIYKEMSRNGQVFILYNKVSDIEERVREIKMLVPDAKVIFAHGQMSKSELEDRMKSFINGEYDCLICTTIIETGIDIPNANSLIILDADRFGLSQLYQIRGRVGRSDRIAYAYLMYNKNKQLNEIAMKRLKVIKEFTELGSGFNIATRDLSIRGAGDILGSEQAGFIDAVGIDLYMKMLENEILKLKGQEVLEDEELDEPIKVEISNHIKDKYVSDLDLKIEIHKLINTIDSEESLEKVKEELEDRFGKLDDDMFTYMNEELFEKLIKKQGVEKINDNNIYIELIFNIEKSNSIDYQEFFVESIKISNNFKFEYKDKKLYLKIYKKDLKEHPIIYLNRLLKKM